MNTIEPKPATKADHAKQDDALRLALHRVILVPMENDNDCSRKALRYAIPFALAANARIVLLNILPLQSRPTYRFDSLRFQWVSDHGAQDDIESKLARLAKEMVPGEVPVEIRLEYGKPSTLILNVARMLDADLIVISTHGWRGLLYVLLGSVAGRVARLATCPVLVVREKEHEFDLGSMSLMKLSTGIPTRQAWVK